MQNLLRMRGTVAVVDLTLQYTAEGKLSGTRCDGSKEIYVFP